MPALSGQRPLAGGNRPGGLSSTREATTTHSPRLRDAVDVISRPDFAGEIVPANGPSLHEAETRSVFL